MKGRGFSAKFPVLLTIVFLFSIGCMSWEEGWKKIEEPSVEGNVSVLIARANKQMQEADSKEKLLQLIETYENVLKIEPRNFEALRRLGSFCFLIGYGYAESRDERETYCLKAIKYSEQVLYSNPDFKQLVDGGEKVWEACRVLSKREMDALWWWYLAAGAYWKECFSAVGRLVNFRWPLRIRKVLSTMMEIDPTWQNGSPYYAWANFYAVAPGFLGGDLKKAAEYYEKAVELGPNMLNFRRSRAWFLHIKTGDRKAFKEDMEWVIAQDPHKAGLTYPWNAFIQRDAQRGLDTIDEYFE
jgi:tetratricopeptide (TPR) repeat protein